MSIWGKTTSTEAADAPAAPPMRDDACPSCGCEFFTPGGPVVHVRSNGERAETPASGAILCCLGCGERWYSTPSGLKRPHESALPPAWAMADLQAKAREVAKQRTDERAERTGRRLAGPHEGFRHPPKV